jgi:hypothetical protein
MNSIKWSRPLFANVDHDMRDFMKYNRDTQIEKFLTPKLARGHKILCDIDRICDIEDSVYDWIKYDPITNPVQL